MRFSTQLLRRSVDNHIEIHDRDSIRECENLSLDAILTDNQ